MRNNKVTISDIAEQLNVSSVSVSRALAGKSGVGEELKAKIIEKAKEMGYLKIKMSESPRILVLHVKPYIQDNSNFSFMVQGIESAIQKVGADYANEFVSEESHQNLIIPHKLTKGEEFDGVIFVGSFDAAYTALIKQKIPAQVHYTGYSPAYNTDSVWFNFNNSGYRQCEYVINKGHRRIGFFGDMSAFKNKEKLLGITTALEHYNIPAQSQFFIDTTDYAEKLYQLLSQAERPTAFVCECDLSAVELCKFLYRKNLRVPDDISVIGSGNSEISAYTIPPLTTMDLNIQYSCNSAVSMLLERISMNDDMPYRSLLIATRLVERESVNTI